jgi:hypothetical protein
MSSITDIFGKAASLLDLIDSVIPVATTHKYTFVSDDWFSEWAESSDFSIQKRNFTIALELVEKAHLASVTALLRARRWADATCLMFEKENLFGWAASFRGLLESAGDTYDGLLQVPTSLAQHHRGISVCLAGEEQNWVNAAQLEDLLDHFVHAKWSRTRGVTKAKENIEYVKRLAVAIPDVERLYHRLCSICHPSSASIDHFFSPEEDRFKISAISDRVAIAGLLAEFPNALESALMLHSNPPILVLRVLHAFGVHPHLKALRQFDLKKINGGADIERLLRR